MDKTVVKTGDIFLQTKNTIKNISMSNYSILDKEEVMFINIETSKGTLQFAVYNCHNGYYGHAVKVISEQLNVETYL